MNQWTISQLLLLLAEMTIGSSYILEKVLFPDDASPGGKCLDGTPAGFFVRRGTNPNLFMIDLEGGGSCDTKEACTKRASSNLGSSKQWPEVREGGNTLHHDCGKNKDFCLATAVFVPYCTGDLHLGTRIETTWESMGYEFHGRYNFMLMIDILEKDYGLGDAKAVLFTGSSAGAFGTYYTVDWLADRLPDAVVKAAPRVGWFYPGALEDDLPDSRIPPSTYDHFKNGEHGNDKYDEIMANEPSSDPWLIGPVIDKQCAEDNADAPQVCTSVHVMYKYIKAPIFVIQPYFDGVHGFGGAPEDIPSNEVEIYKDYVTMWGDAVRSSLDQIMNGESLTEKSHPDGLFSASCLLHGAPQNVLINGLNWHDLLHDWFFQHNELREYHQLVEGCPGGENSLPCNQKADTCQLPPSIRDDDHVNDDIRSCVEILSSSSCFTTNNIETCKSCAWAHRGKLEGICTQDEVAEICSYPEELWPDDNSANNIKGSWASLTILLSYFIMMP